MIATLGLRCAGCGATLPADSPYPFRCPRADSGDGRDHVMTPGEEPREARVLGVFADRFASQPFVRYRSLLRTYALARVRGMDDAEYVEMVEALDEAIERVDGRGFRVTPFSGVDALASRLMMWPGTVSAKDETGNVAGSHKGRHLFGLALALEVAERTRRASRAESDRRGLAIASCGNAALAAAVVARAARRPLRVFIPTDADPMVVTRLHGLSAEVVVCPRDPAVPGDPCMHAFHKAVRAGALPFCCQGSENGLTVEGGMTLAWELAESLGRRRIALDRIFVQVGGGALASAVAQGLKVAVDHGVIPRLPRLHTVQTEGAWPLRRAWERLRERILPGPTCGDACAAERMAAAERRSEVEAALAYAREHRAEFMWPWETAPQSLAHGILDDETYDWHSVAAALIASGGWPVTVSEAQVREAYTLSRETTGVPADYTGTAGLAGLIELRAKGAVADGERCAVLLTGVER